MQGDAFKVTYKVDTASQKPKKVLLALSFGESSLALFDIITALLEEHRQMHRGKQGFQLVVLNIDEFELKSLERHPKDMIKELSEINNAKDVEFKLLDINSYIFNASILRKITMLGDYTFLAESLQDLTEFTIRQLLAQCPDKSSAEDLLSIVKDELIIRTAYLEGCSTVLFAHCMTRLANEVISLTIKGRGSSIHKALADRIVTVRDTEINVIFPLRDILHAEVLAYDKLRNLNKFIIESGIPLSKINKNLTIRELTTNYFRQLDSTGYASTASTVVRTAQKLGSLAPQSTFDTCQICGDEIYRDPVVWLRQITVQTPCVLSSDEEKALFECYKTQNILSAESSPLNDASDQLAVCYGCTVTMGHIARSGYIWPVKSKEDENADILNEYILTDDETEA